MCAITKNIIFSTGSRLITSASSSTSIPYVRLKFRYVRTRVIKMLLNEECLKTFVISNANFSSLSVAETLTYYKTNESSASLQRIGFICISFAALNIVTYYRTYTFCIFIKIIVNSAIHSSTKKIQALGMNPKVRIYIWV